MKDKSLFITIIVIFVILIFGGKTVFPQGEIISVNPPSSFQGETIHLIIQGNGTNFIQGQTEVVFDPSSLISIENTLVNSPELITVLIRIDTKATAGDRYLSVITNSHVCDYDEPFEIIELAGEPEAMITVFPVQSIYLSDYDFSNFKNLPLLFTISVFNSGNDTINVRVVLKHNEYGLVAAGDKRLEFNSSLKIITFDNREFDNYDEDIASDEILENAIGNGRIPPGEYVYTVYLSDENNDPIGVEITSEFYISSFTSGIDMIAPGSPIDSDPILIFENTPYFQWFGGLTDYNFTLYEVLEGQKSVDEIISNIPVYQEKGLTSASYLYPSFAETLKPRKTYAWQITSNLLTSSGSHEIRSEVYWFIYQKSNLSTKELSSIQVYPDDIDLMPGDSVQIKVDGYDINGDTLKVNCDWRVIPEDMGKVDENGWFIAGDKPGTVAITTICGSMEDYITINILKEKR